jgi:hypothetical protein
VNAPEGGVACPFALEPQQATFPFVRMPQLKKGATATWLKVPLGGVAWPTLPSPQHATVPSVRTPQVWSLPAATLL